MTTIVIFFVVIMIAGSFAYARPSPRDLRLSKFRTHGMKIGLKIGQQSIDDLSVEGRINKLKASHTFYRLFFEKTQQGVHPWQIARTSGENGIYLPVGWTWLNESRANDEQLTWLTPWLEGMSTSVSCVQVNVDSCGVSWDEKGELENVDNIKTILLDLQQKLNN